MNLIDRIFTIPALKPYAKSKLGKDFIWTGISFFILAVSGALINLVIGYYRGVVALGVFNLLFAIYTVTSQFATFGLHYSVFYYTARTNYTHKEKAKVIFNGSFVALVLGILAFVVMNIFAKQLTNLFDVSYARTIIWYASLGMILFPLNKVLNSVFNGLRHQKVFAAMQAMRYLVILMVIVFIAMQPKFEYQTFALCFLFAELVVLSVGLFFLRRYKYIFFFQFDIYWLVEHFRFGSRSYLGALFVDMNSRVDVMILGFFRSDYEVGIYSFLSMLCDGMYTIIMLIRSNLNPILVEIVQDDDIQKARSLFHKSRKNTRLLMAIIAGCILIGFLVYAYMFAPAMLTAALLPLSVMLFSLVFVSGYLPFDNLLIAAGKPRVQTGQNLLNLLTKMGLCFLLIPFFGYYGAALATTLSYLLGTMVMIILIKKILNWNLFGNSIVNSFK